MKLVLPLGAGLLVGLAGIALVGIGQSWADVAVAAVAIIGSAASVVVAIGRLADDPPDAAAAAR